MTTRLLTPISPMRLFGFIVAMAILIGGCRQQVPTRLLTARIPPDWVAVSPPAGETPAARCANWAPEEWDVELTANGDALVIVPQKTGPLDALTFADGALMGDDQGEFGGAIWWQRREGGRDTLIVENLHHFIRQGDDIYALVGLAHLSSRGHLVHLRRETTAWQTRRILDLQSAPSAYLPAGGDSVLVLTSDSLLMVRLHPTSPTRRALHGSSVWPFLYATSMVRDAAGTIYIGMRAAVARLTPVPGGYHEDWLVPAACRSRRSAGADVPCICEP